MTAAEKLWNTWSTLVDCIVCPAVFHAVFHAVKSRVRSEGFCAQPNMSDLTDRACEQLVSLDRAVSLSTFSTERESHSISWETSGSVWDGPGLSTPTQILQTQQQRVAHSGFFFLRATGESVSGPFLSINVITTLLQIDRKVLTSRSPLNMYWKPCLSIW